MDARRALLPDGRQRWRHGPIDLIVAADGDPRAIDAAHAEAWACFAGVLAALVGERALLARPIGARPDGAVARRMWDACRPHRPRFITPMAAVAGAVADELIARYRVPGVRRAWINNGGDIALHLAPGASVRVGVVADIRRVAAGVPGIDAGFRIAHAMPVRGVATSGWRGRSFSLGIADSVTVLARSAAVADAAATMIANAVDVDDARIVRRPASSLKDDSDLGERPVTVDVPPLGIAAVRRALDAGLARAEALRAADVVDSCVLVCQGMMAATSPHAASHGDRPGDADARDPRVAWHATRLTNPAAASPDGPRPTPHLAA